MKILHLVGVCSLFILLSACGGKSCSSSSPASCSSSSSNPVNTAPTLASISAQATNQSVKKTVTISAADVDSDSLSYTITSSPSSTVSGSVAGSTLTLTPLPSYNGTAVVTLTVSDGTNTAVEAFNLVVTANDPLYQYQWHLDNTGQTNFATNAGTAGQDINVDGVIIAGYDGSGVVVGVVDSGLDIDHPDISPNIVSDGSWDFRDSDNDPTQDGTTGDHGTSVGGLIFAAGWNGKVDEVFRLQHLQKVLII